MKRALLILATLSATPALAQPFILQLNPKDKDHPPSAAPAPVAPPQSKPSTEQSPQAQAQAPSEQGQSGEESAQPPPSH